MPKFTQEHRAIAIGTPLGDDVLILRSMTVHEALSQPFRIEAELLSGKADIDFDAVVGQNVTLRMLVAKGETRYFNGHVARFVQEATRRELTVYRATIVPWLWFLTRTADCRIFSEQTAPEIIKKVFADHGFTDFRSDLNGSYRTREYCVQYRETDFNFVSRLMEQEGITYYFEHEDGLHTLVLADSSAMHKPFPAYDSIRFRDPDHAAIDTEAIRSWVRSAGVHSGAYALNDFDFKVPGKGLRTKQKITRGHAVSGLEIYDYPGEYTEYADGEAYAKVRIEEAQTGQEVFEGHSDARGIAAGYVFTLTEFAAKRLCKPYLVTEAVISASTEALTSGDTGSGSFDCRLTAIDASRQFRPLRTTPKPFVQGPQTAIVVGPAGEEIHVDQYGRVKVQFHWDREGQANENSSCWIRVAQLWAGKKWGAMYIPRIGQEVIVDFLEGDPDQPIITGRVYNGQNMPPYDLPGEKTKSTVKSNSSKGGAGFNEIRFEDKKGQEQLFVHAEKNEDVRVKNDSMEWVGHDRHLIVKNSQFEKVEVDKHMTVKGDRVGKVEGSDSLTVKGDRMEEVAGSDSLTVSADRMEKIGADFSKKIGANRNEEVGASVSRKAGKNIDEKAGMNYALDAGMAIHIKGGMMVVIEAGVSLTLQVGGNFVSINPAGVAIKGSQVMINSGGAPGFGAGANPTAPSPPAAPDTPIDPKVADTATSGEVTTAKAGPVVKEDQLTLKKTKVATYSPAALVLKQAAVDGTPFCEQCEKAKQGSS